MTNYTKTTNFLAKDSLPSSDTAKIIRGSEFDTEFNNLVVAVASKANLASPALTGVPTAPTASTGTSTTQLATTAFVAQNAILSGMIIMWSGAVATIPTGYVICDGTNSTPDLRNRFVVGAGSTYTPGNIGGSADAINVSHTHTGTTASDGAHTHTGATPSGTNWFYVHNGSDGNWADERYGNDNSANTSSAGLHSHTVAIASAGSSGTNANLPPYWALCFIMKT